MEIFKTTPSAEKLEEAPVTPTTTPAPTVAKTTPPAPTVCPNCENSGLTCSTCGYNKP